MVPQRAAAGIVMVDQSKNAALMKILPPGMRAPMRDMIKRGERCVTCAYARALQWQLSDIAHSCNACKAIKRELDHSFTTGQASLLGLRLCDQHMRSLPEDKLHNWQWHIRLRLGGTCTQCYEALFCRWF